MAVGDGAATPTTRELLAEARDLAEGDRLLLLAGAIGRSRAWLFAHREDRPDARLVARFRAWTERRRRGEPVAYILGRRGFWTLDLTVTPATLIPRPETEHLVEATLAALDGVDAPRVVDLGTGCGAIALALASERPDATIDATDQDPAALAVARGNQRRLGLANVRFHAGDWYGPLGGARFDVIVANPPYLAADDPHLGMGDLPAEPRAALVAGPTGLEAIERIVAGAGAHLTAAGVLILEHGWRQQPAVLARCAAAGLGAAEGVSDLAGHPRFVLARRAADRPQDRSRPSMRLAARCR